MSISHSKINSGCVNIIRLDTRKKKRKPKNEFWKKGGDVKTNGRRVGEGLWGTANSIFRRHGLLHVSKRVETEESALRFACELKLVREGPPPCPRCNAAMKWERGIRRRGVNGVWRCRNKAHTRTSRSLLHGSVFAQLQVPVSSFLKTVFFIAQDMTVDEIVANVHISRPTVIKIHKKLRDLMQQYNTTHKRLIGGVGMVVETDECHIHSRKYGVGRQEASEAWWVVGGICRQTHEMFVVVVEARGGRGVAGTLDLAADSGVLYPFCTPQPDPLDTEQNPQQQDHQKLYGQKPLGHSLEHHTKQRYKDADKPQDPCGDHHPIFSFHAAFSFADSRFSAAVFKSL